MTRLKQKIYRGGMIAAVLAVAAVPMAVSAQTTEDTGTSEITATIGSAISVTTTDPPVIILTPGTGTVQQTVEHTVTVATNNTSGYTLTLAAAGEAALTAEEGGYTIPALSSPGTLTDNTWGYSVGATAGTWRGVSADAYEIATLDNQTSSDTTTVWYGVRVNSEQPTGTYKGTVTYTATTNP